MKIALVAMSGVRASNDELTAVGLTLPGFVERSKVIASLPSLSLLTLAALTPPEHEVHYFEVRDLRTDAPLQTDFDLVAITSFTAQIKDAYAVADCFRAAGVPVVMGGLHVSVLPDEAAQHCDAVAIGEGELLWARIVNDAARGELRPRYQAPQGQEFDLADAPVPRYDLLDLDRYNRLTVQTSRGCPFRCEFCASSILLTKKYKTKPVELVLAEIRAIKKLWSDPFIEFADDNSFVRRSQARQLLAAIARENIKWFTECDVSIADDPELLDFMRESGCRQVLIGLESPNRSGLDGVETRGNWKLKQRDRYECAVRTIQSHGITVNGCFVLGLDGDDESVFDAVYDFVDRTSLYEAQITVQTPFPGTPLYNRLLGEGRIIRPGAWELCTLFDINYIPQRMSPEQLQRGLTDLAMRLYDRDFIKDRRQRFFRGLREAHRTRDLEEQAA